MRIGSLRFLNKPFDSSSPTKGLVLYMRTVLFCKNGRRMKQQNGEQGILRCKPGDIARVVYSTNPLLVGRLVLVEGWGSHSRWDVTLLGEPAFGREFGTGRPLIGRRTAFRDTSLRPINGARQAPQRSVRLESSVA